VLARAPAYARHWTQGHAEEGPVAETDDVLGRAPLFEALDEEGTKALRAGVHTSRWAGVTGCSTRATRETVCT
jgi:hypothetical protein